MIRLQRAQQLPQIGDIDAPASRRITGKGNCGIADAETGDKIAALGSRMVQSMSKKPADQFFRAFSSRK